MNVGQGAPLWTVVLVLSLLALGGGAALLVIMRLAIEQLYPTKEERDRAWTEFLVRWFTERPPGP